MIFYILLYVLLSLSLEDEKVLIAKYGLLFGGYTLTIKAGKDSSTSYVKTINHSSQFLVRPGGSIKEESFIENTTILSKNKTELPVSLIKEDIHIGNFSTMIKSYIITNESLFEQCDNSLPFAHKFDDESYSIVHQLYNNKIISHLAFALGKYQRYEGNFYFGKFPFDEVKSLYQSKCNVDSSDVNWSCSLQYAYFGNEQSEIYVNEEYAKFTSEHFNILASYRFLQFMKKTVFKDYMEKGKCMYTSSDRYHFYSCDCDVLDKLEDIHFVFNNIVHTFKMKDLFEIYDPSEMGSEFCELLISKSNDDKWSFGVMFLEKYMSQFDYESNTISFYSEKQFETFVMKSNSISKYISVFVFIGLLITILNLNPSHEQ